MPMASTSLFSISFIVEAMSGRFYWLKCISLKIRIIEFPCIQFLAFFISSCLVLSISLCFSSAHWLSLYHCDMTIYYGIRHIKSISECRSKQYNLTDFHSVSWRLFINMSKELNHSSINIGSFSFSLPLGIEIRFFGRNNIDPWATRSNFLSAFDAVA